MIKLKNAIGRIGVSLAIIAGLSLGLLSYRLLRRSLTLLRFQALRRMPTAE